MSEVDPATNRRNSARRKPKSGSKVLCVTGRFGMGPNVAVSVLDVSETGIRLILQTSPTLGQEVEIRLEAPGDRRPTVLPAEIIWAVPTADGNVCVGAHFTKPLSYATLQALTVF